MNQQPNTPSPANNRQLAGAMLALVIGLAAAVGSVALGHPPVIGLVIAALGGARLQQAPRRAPARIRVASSPAGAGAPTRWRSRNRLPNCVTG